MPLIEPITSYDAKRRKAPDRRYNPPPADEHMVYFARMGDSRVVKIGRTKNIHNRAKGHTQESGLTPRYLAQLVVASRAEALELEAHILRFVRSRFPVARKEWFGMSDADVSEALFSLNETSPVEIIERRGTPGASDPEPSVFDQASHETRSAAAAHNRMRRGF